jgi:prepilin-type N-terminal cleavage/methylation domain-containing protein
MKTRGFTLIETVVVVAITGIVSGAIGFTLQYFYRTNAYVLEETQATERAHRSVEHVLSDIREASYADDGSYPVAIAATSTITFYADTDADLAAEKVHYYLSGTTFYRGITNSAGSPPSYSGQTEKIDVVVDNVRNATTTIFHYFDNTGIELTSPISLSRIASVKVVVMTDVNPNRAPQVYVLTGSATLRNLRDPSTE